MEVGSRVEAQFRENKVSQKLCLYYFGSRNEKKCVQVLYLYTYRKLVMLLCIQQHQFNSFVQDYPGELVVIPKR